MCITGRPFFLPSFDSLPSIVSFALAVAQRSLHAGPVVLAESKKFIEDLKVLRARSELPMALCKQALAAAGSVDAAMQWLKDNQKIQSR